jgi:hypothetical protein
MEDEGGRQGGVVSRVLLLSVGELRGTARAGRLSLTAAGKRPKDSIGTPLASNFGGGADRISSAVARDRTR